MGCSPLRRACHTNMSITSAPNPSPSQWMLMQCVQYENAHAVMVKYLGCTNYEGKKVIVYKGTYDKDLLVRDPHFAESDNSPLARFKPTEEGWNLAKSFAKGL